MYYVIIVLLLKYYLLYFLIVGIIKVGMVYMSCFMYAISLCGVHFWSYKASK